MNFSSVIINWYNKNKRDLPWRNTRDPYLIWLSEIIMQQTRIEQGLSYYHTFAENYPDIKSLANAKEDDVLKLWQGLGYYSRARNLHKAAKQLMNEFNCKFPRDYDSIKSLNGVGDYTSAAISSFAFDLKHPVVDGNVFRFLSRHFGIKTPIDTSGGKKEFTQLAGELMQDAPPAIFNQAIMEFGSKVCKPSNPDCANCPLNQSCYAYKKKLVLSLPVKKNKTKIRNRYFNYLFIRHNNSFFIKRRNEKDIWQGLYDFPLIESNKKISESLLIRSKEWTNTFGKQKITMLSGGKEYKHILSHQHIHAKFYELSAGTATFNESKGEWKKVNNSSIKKYALPRLIEIFLEQSIDYKEKAK